MPNALVIHAHAKINLTLAVGPPMPPRGYHPICSWFACIDLADEVVLHRLAAGAASRFVVEWAEDAPRASPIDWPLEKDLAVRAHALLEQRVGRALPVEMRIRKRVPVGGGLGGGSSDAAAAMLGLNRVFGLGLTRDELVEIGMRLGSDIGFFVRALPEPEGTEAHASSAQVSGFGEVIELVEGAAAGAVRCPREVAHNLLLILPPFGCPTGAVYQTFDRDVRGDWGPSRVRAVLNRAAHEGEVLAADLFNDLAIPACRAEPRLEALRERLNAAMPEERIHITGSGSTMFIWLGLRSGPDWKAPGIALADRIREVAPEVAVVLARTL